MIIKLNSVDEILWLINVIGVLFKLVEFSWFFGVMGRNIFCVWDYKKWYKGKEYFKGDYFKLMCWYKYFKVYICGFLNY